MVPDDHKQQDYWSTHQQSLRGRVTQVLRFTRSSILQSVQSSRSFQSVQSPTPKSTNSVNPHNPSSPRSFCGTQTGRRLPGGRTGRRRTRTIARRTRWRQSQTRRPDRADGDSRRRDDRTERTATDGDATCIAPADPTPGTEGGPD